MSTGRVALCLALLAGTAAAQDAFLEGEVRGSDGRPLADAIVHVVSPSRAVPACPWLVGVIPVSTRPYRTDDAGRFSVPVWPRATLWIEGAHEGALVNVVAPDAPLAVTTAPFGELTLDESPTAPRAARGAWVRVDGLELGFAPFTRRDLLALSIPVPAGNVDLLVDSSEGDFIAHCRVAAGARVAIPRPEGSPTRLRDVPAHTVITVWPWFGRTAEPNARGDVVLPASNQPLRVRLAMTDGRDSAHEDLWLEPGSEHRWQRPPLAWRTLRVLRSDGTPVVDALVVTVRTGSGYAAVASSSATATDGTARWRSVPGPSTVVVIEGRSALVALSPADAPPEVRLAPGATARLRIVDQRGRAVVGAMVTTQIDPALDQEVTSDARGGVVLTHLPAHKVTISVEHPDFIAGRYVIDPSARAALDVELEHGFEIHGVVTCRDPSRLLDAVVEIRDVSGVTGMPARTVAPDAEGHFVFRGLEDQLYTVFARSTRDGVTWSGRCADVRPHGEPLAIELVNDDPTPTGSTNPR